MFTLGETFSAYEISFAENVTCEHLCTKTFVGGDPKDKEQLDALKKGLTLKLKRHWVFDFDIPGLWCPELDSDIEIGIQNRSYCVTGFPIGCYTGYEMDNFCYKIFNKYGYREKYFIFNHVDFIMIYEGSSEYPSKSKLVNVKVVPSSISHSNDTDCSSENPLEIPKGDIPLGQSFHVKYTYSIQFIRNDNMKWSSRWNYIFQSMPFSNLHWIPLMYSILAILFIVLVPLIIITSVYRDSKSYKMMECGETVDPKLRWILITHGYARPAVRVSLSILLGSVFYLICMAISALGFSLLAYLQCDGRDSQMLWALGVFIILGSVGGYFASLFYKSFGGEHWKTNILITSIVCPGIAMSVFIVLDCILFFKDSSASLPIYTLSGFAGVIYLLIVPLTAVGYVLGFHS
ncbi:transmembrane 9 superfamily member 2 isoform X2 [Halyomorpha halys]|nr:transmembrane 9 superfamily member 2-like isoform X2 [Halyomorpha halys]